MSLYKLSRSERSAGKETLEPPRSRTKGRGHDLSEGITGLDIPVQFGIDELAGATGQGARAAAQAAAKAAARRVLSEHGSMADQGGRKGGREGRECVWVCLKTFLTVQRAQHK